MSSKKKKSTIKGLTIAYISIGMLVAAGVVAALVMSHTGKAMAESQAKPAFAFDDATAHGWWSGGNNWPNGDDYTGGQMAEVDLPIADISIHQCRSADQCKTQQDIVGGQCFVMLGYYSRSISLEAALQEELDSLSRGGMVASKEIGVQTITMSTTDGVRQFQLHQYELTKSSGEDVMRGMARGYIPLKGGHIEVQSTCQDAGQLDEASRILNAVSLTQAGG